MKTIVFSDVHGNLPAFELMLKKHSDIHSFICLGDLVNYGPWSNECVDLATSLPSRSLIMGNHEEAFLQGFYPGSNELVKTFFSVCIPDFNRMDAIRTFKEGVDRCGFRFRHTIANQYIYPDTNIGLDNNYVIGHSHHQFKYTNGGHVLINAGSVGQNRKYINVINYLILETDTCEFLMESLVYDVNILISEMKARKYPQECIDYYANKEKVTL